MTWKIHDVNVNHKTNVGLAKGSEMGRISV